MLTYNTQLKPLALPEYGRMIHQMVEYATQIPDRDERTRCAFAIAKIMKNLFPQEFASPDGERKMWDHINIISDFKLDIDFPVEVSSAEAIHPKPEPIPYGDQNIRHRYYGKNIQMMIDRVAELEEGPEKDSLISMIAHHMKKLMFTHNKEGVNDARILRDLAEYSKGRIQLDPETYILHEFREIEPVQNGKKKKKK
ncbi:MAG: DUF4290 domain-containing protein [Porphyromonadaceae bacterium]|jgi:hypothetical protein|nr:DUF4290 domain-containing protein [Porphyromonadaceae bacterium]